MPRVVAAAVEAVRPEELGASQASLVEVVAGEQRLEATSSMEERRGRMVRQELTLAAVC